MGGSLVTKPTWVIVVATLNHSSATLGLHRTIRIIYAVCVDNVRSGSELMTKARNHARRKITPAAYWHQPRCMSESPKAGNGKIQHIAVWNERLGWLKLARQGGAYVY